MKYENKDKAKMLITQLESIEEKGSFLLQLLWATEASETGGEIEIRLQGESLTIPSGPETLKSVIAVLGESLSEIEVEKKNQLQTL